MQSLRMKTESLPAFIESLKAWGTVWAPVEKAPGVFALETMGDVAKARPDALRTILPFKKLLLKPRSRCWSARAAARPASARQRPRPVVFFGAHSCDIHALKILDLLTCRIPWTPTTSAIASS